MAEPWAVDGVLEEISRASSTGEYLSRAELQERLGIGTGDLDAALDELRVTGKVREAEPNAWGRVAVSPGPPPQPPALGSEELQGDMEPAGSVAALPGFPRAEPQAVREDRETILSRAMVESLEPAALGALVLAGVKGEDGAFVLRVEP